MRDDNFGELAEAVIEENQYLALGTTDGEDPWVAPIEYFRDGAGNFYFFSTTDSRHARHIEENDTVSVAIWNTDQPEYSPELSESLNGVQIEGRAKRLSEDEYPPLVEGAIEEVSIPMPPYEAFAIEPLKVYVPVVEDGVNERVEVE